MKSTTELALDAALDRARTAESALADALAEAERLQVYHADDEPSWRHRAEALEAKTEHERRELRVALADALLVIGALDVQLLHEGRVLEAKRNFIDADWKPHEWPKAEAIAAFKRMIERREASK